ncbi:MAG: Glycerol kinase [Pseudomonadota bacterium]|jgi:glycerol kinase
MNSSILALDQGTTSSRAMVFSLSGECLAVAQEEFTQHFPHPGWVEHDAEQIWHTQEKVMRAALAQAGAQAAAKPTAIAITNQRETTVLWHRHSGKPLAPAIVWQDRRTAPVCAALKAEGKAAMIQAKTGLVLDAYFSATKLAWLLDHTPNARAMADAGELAFGTIDTWLMWKLTQGRCHATDPSNASRTLLFNIHTQTWDEELLALFRIPRSVLPEVKPSSGFFADAFVDGSTLPIMGLAGDQQAALYGQSCLRAGEAKNTYGTGCFMLMNTGTQAVSSKNQLLTTTAWQIGNSPPQYAMEGSVFMAGAIVQWLRDNLGIINTASDIEALAGSVPGSEGVCLVPAFVGLGAPHWNADARAMLCGLSRGSTRAHIARAALEAIALQNLDVVNAMRSDSGLALQSLRVDGGATQNALLMQIQADLLEVPVVRAGNAESTAWGAAKLAATALGLATVDAGQAQHFYPDLGRARQEQMNGLKTRWQEAIQACLGLS